MIFVMVIGLLVFIVFLFCFVMFWIVSFMLSGSFVLDGYMCIIILLVFVFSVIFNIMGWIVYLGLFILGLIVFEGLFLGVSLVKKLDSIIMSVFVSFFVIIFVMKVDFLFFYYDGEFLIYFIIVIFMFSIGKLVVFVGIVLYFKMFFYDVLVFGFMMCSKGIVEFVVCFYFYDSNVSVYMMLDLYMYIYIYM